MLGGGGGSVAIGLMVYASDIVVVGDCVLYVGRVVSSVEVAWQRHTVGVGDCCWTGGGLLR